MSMEIRRAGKNVQVPSVMINDCAVVATGGWVKIATIHDEEFLEGRPVDNPQLFVTAARNQLRADIFTFSQKLTEPEPQHTLPFEWEAVAEVACNRALQDMEGQPKMIIGRVIRNGERTAEKQTARN